MREGIGFGGWSFGVLLVAGCLVAAAVFGFGAALGVLTDGLGADAADAVVAERRGPDRLPEIGDAAVEHPPPALDLTVVRVSVTTCGERRNGTGVLIDDGLVLTAAHVVGDAALVRVDGPYSTTGEVIGVAVDGRDLALVDVGFPLDAPVRTTTASVGDPVAVAGHPAGGPLTLDTGPVVELAPEVAARVEGTVVGVDAASTVGFSGGPAVARDGGLVGIVVATETVSSTALVVAVDDLSVLTPEHVVPGICPQTA